MPDCETAKVVVNASGSGMRLLHFATRAFPDILGTTRRTKRALKLNMILRKTGDVVLLARPAMILEEGDTVMVVDPRWTAKVLDERDLREYCSDCEVIHEDRRHEYLIMWKPAGVHCRCKPCAPKNWLCLEHALPTLLEKQLHVPKSYPSAMPPHLVTSLGRAECGLVLVAWFEQDKNDAASIERRFRILFAGEVAPEDATRILATACQHLGSTELRASCQVVDVTGSDRESMAVTTIDVWLSWDIDIRDVQSAFSAAGHPPIGARHVKSFGRGCYVACLELRSFGGRFGNLSAAVGEPGKFGTFRSLVARRLRRRVSSNLGDGQVWSPPSLTSADAGVQPPASAAEAALQYCELAVRLRTPRRQVHFHLIGRLSMLDQSALRSDHTALYQAIRSLADDPTECSREDGTMKGIIDSLRKMCSKTAPRAS